MDKTNPTKSLKFAEPMGGKTLEFALIPVSRLLPGEYQRDLSTGLVNKLLKSTSVGFAIPLVVTPAGDGRYEVLDGQHRLATLQKIKEGVDVSIPCVITPPSMFKEHPLLLNLEKGDNIKDKCTKVHAVYMKALTLFPEKEESDLLPATSFQPHLFTLAFSYAEKGLASPSLVETVVKKFDSTLSGALSVVVSERRERAQKVSDLEGLVDSIARQNNIRDFNLKKAIISKSSMSLWGRSRSTGDDFDTSMQMLMSAIEETDWSAYGK